MSYASLPTVITLLPYNHAFQVPQPTNLDPYIVNSIGNKINPVFASGKKWTPAQKKRAIAITSLALSSLVTLAALFAALATLSTLPLIVGLIGITAFTISAIYLVCMKPDLDDPKKRNAVMNQIVHLSPHEMIATVANEHGVDRVLGYALLDRITGPKAYGYQSSNGFNPDARDIFYCQFKDIATAYLSIQQQHLQHKNEIEKIYDATITPLRMWRDARQAEVDRTNRLGNGIERSTRQHNHEARSAPSRRGDPRNTPYGVAGQDARNRRGNAGGKILEVAGSIANTAIHVQGYMTMEQVRKTYEAGIYPAQTWRTQELTLENQAHQYAVQSLNLGANYQNMLRGLQSSLNSQLLPASGMGVPVPRAIPQPSAPPLPSAFPLPSAPPPPYAPS